MIPTAETLKLVCVHLFGFEPEAEIVAANEELIKAIISNEVNDESVSAFYDYISGDNSHDTQDKAWKTIQNIEEYRALFLIDAFTIPLEEIKRRYKIDLVRYKAYNYYTLRILDQKYPSTISYNHYLEMICRCLDSNSKIIENFTSI